MSTRTSSSANTASFWLGALLMLFAFFTYFWNYTNPPYLYWDENYHIASAQKYLNGVYFMEPHPPLGKMLIAAGEALINANDEDDQFIGTDYAKELPAGFSFKGYRFFPVVLGWLIAPLLYLIFLLITRKPIWAFLLSFLYVFDNALITHSRAAMLDSTMLFFCVGMIALYYLLLKHKNNKNTFPLFSLLFGACFACAMATKALALIMVLLVPMILLALKKNFHLISQFLALSIGAFLIVYIGIWQAHFMMGTRIISSLPDDGYYQASDEYKALLQRGEVHLPIMIRDNLAFLTHYSKGVPTLNLCKSDENGSPFYYWPLGARSINYRWETPNGAVYKYITLQVNPVVWGIALVSLIATFALLLGSVLLPGAKPLTYRNELLFWFGMWTSYMIAISQIDRVMYLYHYFIPLIFSFMLVAYVFMELSQLGVLKLSESKKNWILLCGGVCIVIGFQFFRPLSYYEPMSDAAFRKRMLLPLWNLRCVHCEEVRSIATPILCDN
ncbi:phospholipid carrier-dependent glycosyltransferase [Candidatus Peribacteria bacterium]|nr:phospholipid carrier-dependent glycosyltransferase [Candidatus Peribacteria bacterium]